MERVSIECLGTIAPAILDSMGRIAKMVCSIAFIVIIGTDRCHRYLVLALKHEVMLYSLKLFSYFHVCCNGLHSS